MSIFSRIKKEGEEVGDAFLRGVKQGLTVPSDKIDLGPEDFYADPSLLKKLEPKLASLVDIAMKHLYRDWEERKRGY